MPTYAIKRSTSLSPVDAEDAIRAALAEQGFGVLTEIDLQATMKAKLDRDIAPYKILGACRPQLASHALDAEPDVGLLLPCNVVVYGVEGGSIVAALDPGAMLGLAENEAMADVATQAKELLTAAVETLPSA